jgi:hypothetical protein
MCALCSCGECGVVCGTNQTCCNGLCVNLATDPGNCGACNFKCASIPNVQSATCMNSALPVTEQREILSLPVLWHEVPWHDGETAAALVNDAKTSGRLVTSPALRHCRTVGGGDALRKRGPLQCMA